MTLMTLLKKEQNAFEVKVVNMSNREVEIKYNCWFQGAIIKSKVQVILNSKNGN